MFSNRFHWEVKPNRLTNLLGAKRAAGMAVSDLTESNPTRAALDYPTDVLEAFSDSANLRYEPAAAGAWAAREAVAAYYAARGRTVSPERILLTSSTSEAYSYLFKLLTNPGDAVAVPRPSYPLFDYLATMESVTVRTYPLVYRGGWSIEFAAMPDSVKAILLVNPNNPTGSFLKQPEWTQLAATGVPLISDEVFSDYAFAPDPARVETLAGFDDCLSFSMSGLSKIAGLPQVKLGWIVVNGPPALRREAFEKLEWIADTYLSVSTPVQHAAAALLHAGESVQAQIRSRTAANLAIARDTFAGASATVLQVEGGWYAILQVPKVHSEEEWTLMLLDRYNTLVQPGFFFDFEEEAYLVISLLTPSPVFREGTVRLKQLLAEES
jgi:hypothetical protein